MVAPAPNPPAESDAPGAENGPHTVTVGLLSADRVEGTIASFSRYRAELVLSPPRRIPAEMVAFVGFQKSDREPAARRDARCKHLNVHTTSGQVFSVSVQPSELTNPLGFYGWPADEESPYREIFFYAHGVRHRESADTLGALLARAGARAKEALTRAHPSDADPARPPEPGAVAVLPERRKRIGELLIEAGLATNEDIERALGVQRQSGAGKRLGEILVEMGVVTEIDLALSLADHPGAMLEVPTALLNRPLEPSASLPAATPLPPPPIASPVPPEPPPPAPPAPAQPERAPDLGGQDEIEHILKELQADEASAKTEPTADRIEPNVDESDSAVIRLANQIIIDAYRRGVSDIHIEPNGREATTIVRFRIDGECIKYQEVPPAFRAPLVARLKIMAKLDISERRKPQDGKIRLKIKGQPVELRVATLPTVNDNEDVVLRILAASKPIPLTEMGLSDRNLRELTLLVAKPYGLVLCVGPTGSGKTTTLHSALGSINTVDTKIWTAEDPVEITQPGLRQVQVNAKIGFTFAAAMRAFLRANADVIMVGEMRDKETAGTAVEASLTGHLVLSTLHTNSAPETITRLLDMGLDPFSFSDALLGVLAQRLARALCKSCRAPYAPTEEEQAQLATLYGAEMLAHDFGEQPLQLWRAPGCGVCMQSGYKGRVAIHELLVTNPAMQHAIAQRAPAEQVRALAMEGGMRTLLQDGIAKALAGRTDLKQVLAVCAK